MNYVRVITVARPVRCVGPIEEIELLYRGRAGDNQHIMSTRNFVVVLRENYRTEPTILTEQYNLCARETLSP